MSSRPGRPAAPSSQSVIGADERVQVTATEPFPFSAVYLELEDSFGVVFASCTATFIGPDALLTAGHCLWDAELEDWARNTSG